MNQQIFKIVEIKPGVFNLSLGDFISRERALVVACELAEATYPTEQRERMRISEFRKELEGIIKEKEAKNSNVKRFYDARQTR